MNSYVQQLVAVSGPALGSPLADSSSLEGRWGQVRGARLAALLCERNGFYAFEGALHVFPAVSSLQSVGLDDWNHPSLWRSTFPDLSSTWVCFAQDIFGVQFCVDEHGIATLDPETGDIERICESMEEWAETIVSDSALWTGYPLAHEWQQQHGALPRDMRLAPIIPFILGGRFEVNNLHLLDSVTCQRMRGTIAAQLKDLPDGARVRLVTE